MFICKHKLLLVLLILPVFLPVHFVRAAEPETFTLTFKKEKFLVDKNTLNSWRGRQTLPANKSFSQTPNLESQLLELVGQPQSTTEILATHNYQLSPVYRFVEEIAKKIDTEAVEPILEINNNQATEFTPPKTGIKIDSYQTALKTISALEDGQPTLGMLAYESQPQKQLAETNGLGITELIAEGVSSFKGSPKNRRHNITVGVEKFKGIIIRRGEEFSFNKYLGPVDGENGFLPELVIKKEGTIPEFGGGLCQVSSTTFRAAMDGGLPITQRRNHAYAVQYYAPQGTDATIYPGVVDFKFINDTPGSILIWPYFKDADTLIFDFYGTKDGRTVKLEKPTVYDKKDDGSMKATWTRVVTKDGNVSTSTFKSIYQPPALFHKTEEFPKVPTSTPTNANTGQAVQ